VICPLQKSEYSNLKITEVTMGGDWKVLNKSGRDESIWVVIHLCVEAMIGISLYRYPYHKLEKSAMSFLLLLMSSLQQKLEKRAEQIMPGSDRVVEGKQGYGEQRG
jgi:hypothetical protein